MSERIKKTFWYADLENLRVIESNGLSTNTPNVWWFVELGYSLTLGIHVFETQAQAQNALGIEANGVLNRLITKTQCVFRYLSENTCVVRRAECCWCENGFFGFDGGVFESLPPQYEYKCSNCGAKATLIPSDIREQEKNDDTANV